MSRLLSTKTSGWVARSRVVHLGVAHSRKRAAPQVGVVLGAVALAVACSPPPESRSPRPSLVAAAQAPAAFNSPARWQYHPASLAGSVRASAAVGDGRLFVTDQGERWLIAPGQPPAVAPTLAPESLDGLVRLETGEWVFVGRSGTTYEARQPTGPFERFSAPTKAFAAVTVTPRALVGVTTEGELQRSENMGLSWQGVNTVGRVADVAVLPSGAGLALLVPERLLQTTDFGRTWSALDESPFGAVSLIARGDIIEVEGVLGTRAFNPSSDARWQDPAADRSESRPSVRILPRANARAVVGGTGVVDDEHYFQLLRVDGKWALRRGRAFEPLEQLATNGLEGCERVELTGTVAALFAACGRKDETRILLSRDQGERWRPHVSGLRADFDLLQISPFGSEELVLSGICPPKESNKGCVPSGVYVTRGQSGSRVQLERLVVPQLEGVPLGIGSSRQGRRIFLVGRRSKSDALVVFSTDERASVFRAEEVAELELEFHSRSSRDSLAVEGLVPGPDDTVAVIVRELQSGQRSLLLLDASGNVVSVGEAPLESALLGGAGAYAIAVDPEQGDAWESLDGGVTWQSIGTTPAPLCEPGAENRCSPNLACWQRGCLLDDQVTRIGWRGQEEVGQHPLPPASKPQAPLPQLRTAIACRLDVDDKWQTLSARAVPDAGSARLGSVSWFALDDDYESGAVRMHEAVSAPEPHIETINLLPPAANPKDQALYAALQLEGIAAFRQASQGAPTVVWRNLFEGRRTHLAKAPVAARVSARPTRFDVALAEPELLSVSMGGVFLRSRSMGEASPVYFLRDGAVDVLPTLAWPKLQRSARAEMIHADGTPLAVSIVQAGAAIVRLRQVGREWQRDAITLGLLQPGAFSIRQEFGLAYFGDRPGLHLMFLDGRHEESYWFPFSGGAEPFGAPVAVPSQAHLSSAPPVCSGRVRADTPRLITPSERDTRHPVVITHTTEPIGGMLSDDAVVQGTLDEPCIAALHAEAVGTTGVKFTALVTPDGSNDSWLFREGAGGEGFDTRRMNCDFDSAIEIPHEIDEALLRPANR